MIKSLKLRLTKEPLGIAALSRNLRSRHIVPLRKRQMVYVGVVPVVPGETSSVDLNTPHAAGHAGVSLEDIAEQERHGRGLLVRNGAVFATEAEFLRGDGRELL